MTCAGLSSSIWFCAFSCHVYINPRNADSAIFGPLPLEGHALTKRRRHQPRRQSSHLVLVRANERLFVVVREEAVLQTEVARLPLGEELALFHQVTLSSHIEKINIHTLGRADFANADISRRADRSLVYNVRISYGSCCPG